MSREEVVADRLLDGDHGLADTMRIRARNLRRMDPRATGGRFGGASLWARCAVKSTNDRETT